MPRFAPETRYTVGDMVECLGRSQAYSDFYLISQGIKSTEFDFQGGVLLTNVQVSGQPYFFMCMMHSVRLVTGPGLSVAHDMHDKCDVAGPWDLTRLHSR